MLVPLLYLDSITKTPKDRPLIILFLALNLDDNFSSSGGYSLIIKPLFSRIFLHKIAFSGGNILLKPLPNTAIVFPS